MMKMWLKQMDGAQTADAELQQTEQYFRPRPSSSKPKGRLMMLLSSPTRLSRAPPCCPGGQQSVPGLQVTPGLNEDQPFL